MKVKIQELINTVIPKYEYFGNKNIFTLKISDKFKYLILPINIFPTNINTVPFMLFYDGTINGRVSGSEYASLGANFMPSLYSADSHYEDPLRISGWTSGTPFGYITSREIEYSVKVLTGQGLTATSKSYVWMNFETPWESYILFNGYTGPTTELDGISQAIASDFYGKLLLGGTGSDGVTFNGLKHYFPGISFGYYGQPRWPYYMLGNDVARLDNEVVDAAIDFAATEWVGCTGLADGVDVLMPSLYSVVNLPRLVRVKNGQNIKLCKKINEKLVAAGKSPKQIIPFTSPFHWTYQTSTPYFHQEWNNNKKYKYTPPYTFNTDDESRYLAGEQLIQQGADGVICWAAIQYAGIQIKGRPYSPDNEEEEIIGAESWRQGPTAGVTNPWSWKASKRQAVSAQENYLKGVCMGITGNRWWWQSNSSTETYTPPEWSPLGTNPVLGATTGITGSAMVDRLLKNAIYDQLNVFKGLAQNTAWLSSSESILKSSGLLPDMSEYNPSESELLGSTLSINQSQYYPLS
jgi:hypothetical protein